MFCEIQTHAVGWQVSFSWPHVLPSSPSSLGGSSPPPENCPACVCPRTQNRDVPLLEIPSWGLPRARFLNQINLKLSNVHHILFIFFILLILFHQQMWPFLLFTICFIRQEQSSQRAPCVYQHLELCLHAGLTCWKSPLRAYLVKVTLEVTPFSRQYIKTHTKLGKCVSGKGSVVMVSTVTNAMQFNLLPIFQVSDLGF